MKNALWEYIFMNQLIITHFKDKLISCFLEDTELVQINCEDSNAKNILGNIYVGKIKNIVKNINAAFVEIENQTMCYLPLEKNPTAVFTKPKKNNKWNIGDELLVQITKESIKTKAPMASSCLNFTGKYVVLTHGKTGIGISGKIKDKEKREHLQKVMKPYGTKEYGFIVRTNSVSAPEEEIIEETLYLINRYEILKTTGIHKNCFSLVEKAPSGYLCDIRDGYSQNIDQIVTDDATLYQEMKSYLELNQKKDLEKLRLYTDTTISLNHLYSIETKITKALQEKVWLKSGGYLVIQPTEALTSIDVNTGKAIAGKRRAEETFFKINLEAAEEIAKQIRLRNLSGILIIDFIDMASRENQIRLIEYLKTKIAKDPIPTQFIDLTALHLVELTRKKQRKPLHEQLRDSKQQT